MKRGTPASHAASDIKVSKRHKNTACVKRRRLILTRHMEKNFRNIGSELRSDRNTDKGSSDYELRNRLNSHGSPDPHIFTTPLMQIIRRWTEIFMSTKNKWDAENASLLEDISRLQLENATLKSRLERLNGRTTDDKSLQKSLDRPRRRGRYVSIDSNIISDIGRDTSTISSDTSGLGAALRVAPSINAQGLGLFSKEFITKGNFIGIYSGILISGNEKVPLDKMMFEFSRGASRSEGKNMLIDAYTYLNKNYLINHSPIGNVIWDFEDTEFGKHIVIRAAVDIDPGKELLAKYHPSKTFTFSRSNDISIPRDYALAKNHDYALHSGQYVEIEGQRKCKVKGKARRIYRRQAWVGLIVGVELSKDQGTDDDILVHWGSTRLWNKEGKIELLKAEPSCVSASKLERVIEISANIQRATIYRD